MPITPIRLNGRRVIVHKAIIQPDFRSRTVLVADAWEFVEMWLRREQDVEDALFYWQQAREFYRASRELPPVSSPVLSYYCFLNAVKALLAVRRATASPEHGVSGTTLDGPVSLVSERVTIKTSGVLPALCRYLGETANGESHTLKDLLYNLPYVHRAYTLTFTSQPELFVPLTSPTYIRKTASSEAWIIAAVPDRHNQTERFVARLPPGWERDRGATDLFRIRRNARFDWRVAASQRNQNIERLTTYHRRTRAHLYYIAGPVRLWYIKCRQNSPQSISRSSITLTFAAMHRLSELARYDPMRLSKHLRARHNWLLSEFISIAPYQFIDQIAAELTGQEFMAPGIRPTESSG